VLLVGIPATDPLAAQLSLELRQLHYHVRFSDWESALEAIVDAPRKDTSTILRIGPDRGRAELWAFHREPQRLERTEVQSLEPGDSPRVHALKIVEMLRAETRREAGATEVESKASDPRLDDANVETAASTAPEGETSFRVLGGAQWLVENRWVPTVGLSAHVHLENLELGMLGRFGFAGDLVTTAPADVQEIALGLTVRHWFALGPTTAIAPELGLGGIVSLIDAQVLGVERTTSTVSPLLSPGLSLGQELGSPHAVLVLGLRTDLLTRRARVLAGEFGLYDSGHVRLAAELGLGGRF
jgi:hypothetical protein